MTEGKSTKENKAAAISIVQKLDSALVSKAVIALSKFHDKKVESLDKEQLFGTDSPIHVQFDLEVAPVKHNPKPLRLSIPNPIFKLNDSDVSDLEEAEVCLIVKDDAKPWLQEMIEKFPEHMKCVKKVMTLTSLRRKHSEYKQKRELLRKYSVFMADDRILPMLHKALGKIFWEAKKQPIPIRITRKEALPLSIKKALSATYITLNAGPCVSAKAGFTNMDTDLLVQNIMSLVSEAAPKIPRTWANIRSIGIKTNDSVRLPIYNKTPEQLEEIAKLAGLPPVYVEETELETTKKHKRDDDDKDKEAVEVIKSPLLKALKKQKQMEKEEQSPSPSKKTKLDNSAKKTKKEKEEKDKKKANEADSEKAELKQNHTPEKKRKQSIEMEVSVEKTPKTKENEEPKKDESSKKKVKKNKKDKTPTKEDSMQASFDANADFVASPKFAGSKKSFVYQKGSKGLGYYTDVKPVVDNAKIQAILRSAKQSPRGSGGKGKKRGGRR